MTRPAGARLIAQQRIRSVHSHLIGVPRGAPITPALVHLSGHRARLREIGFPEPLAPGQVLLPAIVGPRSRFNADGRELVHRDRPKETVTHLAWARWLERHGDDQREVRGVRPWTYQRFPRTEVPAPGVELRVVALAGGLTVVAAETIARGADDARLLHSINLLLELFGECSLLGDEDLGPAPEPGTRLNWDLLAPDDPPHMTSRLGAVLGDLPLKDRQVAEYRIARVGELEPDFLAVGRAGFRGCAVFGFTGRGRYVLESLYHGSETLVTDRGWQELSRLGKAELLSDRVHEQRIAHSRGWESRLRDAVAS